MPRLSLAALPDAAAATLAAFLGADAARAVVLSGRHAPPLFAEAFQRRYTLRIPPDAARNARLVQLIQAHVAAGADSPDQDPSPPSPPVLATHFTVADMDVAASVLVPIRHRVHGLAVSSDAYTAWPVQPFRWDVVAAMPALVRLEIDRVWDEPIDLSALSASAPRLQELVITRASKVTHALGDLPLLRALHLEDTNINSFAIAVGLPRLRSLTLLTSPEDHSAFCDAASLALVAPLVRLVVRGRWETCPRAAMNAHAATLREYSELDHTLPSYTPRNPKCPDWTSLRHLQTLRIGRYEQTDIQPLAELVSLEHLQLVMSERATHCRPLRHLKQLRELQLSNGWLCDLVGYLPRLEKLVWEDSSGMFNNYRQVLWRRVWPDTHDGNDEASVRRSTKNEGVGVTVGLRQLVLRGVVFIQDCAVVYTMLEHVEHLEVGSPACAT